MGVHARRGCSLIIKYGVNSHFPSAARASSKRAAARCASGASEQISNHDKVVAMKRAEGQ